MMKIEEYIENYASYTKEERQKEAQRIRQAMTEEFIAMNPEELDDKDFDVLERHFINPAGTYIDEAIAKLMEDTYVIDDLVTREDGENVKNAHPYLLLALAENGLFYSYSFDVSDEFIQLLIIQNIKEDTVDIFDCLVSLYEHTNNPFIKKAIGLEFLTYNEEDCGEELMEIIHPILKELNLPENAMNYKGEIADYIQDVMMGKIQPAQAYTGDTPFFLLPIATQYYYVAKGQYLEEAILSPTLIRQEALSHLNYKRQGKNELFLWDMNSEILSEGLLLHSDPKTLVDHDNPFLRAVMLEQGIGSSVLRWDNDPIVELVQEKQNYMDDLVKQFLESNS